MLKNKIIKNYKAKKTANHDFIAVLKVLGDSNRYRIFQILSDHSDLSVGDIAKMLDISLPLTSIHLKVLTNAKLVLKEKSGKKIYPKLDLKNPLVRVLIQAIIMSSK